MNEARRHLLPRSDQALFPFDVLLLGGDGLVMVTAADRAVETAMTIVECFSHRTEQQLGQRRNLSASVVFARTHCPLNALLKPAEGGLKHARREGAARTRHNFQCPSAAFTL